jgi:hypothetical protein
VVIADLNNQIETGKKGQRDYLILVLLGHLNSLNLSKETSPIIAEYYFIEITQKKL